MFDLNKFYYFQEVASLGSISAASKKLNISQPALSLQIKGLEEQIGIKLFTRSNRKLSLTPVGRDLLGKARELKDWKHDISNILYDKNNMSGEISIGTYTTASSYLLSGLISSFSKKYPEISFAYNYETTESIINKVIHHELDCAILSGVSNIDTIEKTIIYKSKMILTCSTKIKIPKIIKAKDIEKFNFLSYSIPGDYCYQSINKKFKKHIDKCFKPLITENFETLKHGLLTEMGISFMPEYIIQDELKTKKLKEIKIENIKEIPIHFQLITAHDRSFGLKMKTWKDYLLEQT